MPFLPLGRVAREEGTTWLLSFGDEQLWGSGCESGVCLAEMKGQGSRVSEQGARRDSACSFSTASACGPSAPRRVPQANR